MAAYTTNEKVRDEAGFGSNINIAESKVTDALNAAHDDVRGVVSQLYTMPLAEVPAKLELIERRLAAGYLMTTEYGEQAEGTSKEGQGKIDWAMDQLAKIEDGTIVLLKSNDEPLERNPSAGMEGYPLVSDPDDPEAGERAFTRDMEF